jgi:hypothetical protein
MTADARWMPRSVRLNREVLAKALMQIAEKEAAEFLRKAVKP